MILFSSASIRNRVPKAYRLELGQISLTFPDTGVGEGLDSTVTNWHSRKDERVLDNEFEDMCQRQESEIGIVLDENVV